MTRRLGAATAREVAHIQRRLAPILDSAKLGYAGAASAGRELAAGAAAASASADDALETNDEPDACVTRAIDVAHERLTIDLASYAAADVGIAAQFAAALDDSGRPSRCGTLDASTGVTSRCRKPQGHADAHYFAPELEVFPVRATFDGNGRPDLARRGVPVTTHPHTHTPASVASQCDAVHSASGDRCERSTHKGTLHVRPGGRVWRTPDPDVAAVAAGLNVPPSTIAADLEAVEYRAPAWAAWKSHLVECAECTAGNVCADGRGALAGAAPSDAPWLEWFGVRDVVRSLAPQPDAVATYRAGREAAARLRDRLGHARPYWATVDGLVGDFRADDVGAVLNLLDVLGVPV